MSTMEVKVEGRCKCMNREKQAMVTDLQTMDKTVHHGKTDKHYVLCDSPKNGVTVCAAGAVGEPDITVCHAGSVNLTMEGNICPEKKQSVLIRFRTDSDFKQKIIRTAILCWCYTGVGWTFGMNGPVFPELRQIINEDLSKSSWMFTVASFGFVSGSLSGGIFYDKCNEIILLTVVSAGLGLTTLLTPYCKTLPWMLLLKYFSGLCAGSINAGVNADIFYLWGPGADADSYVQALHFGFSFGAVLAPLGTEPFLSRQTCQTQHTTESVTENEGLATVPSVINATLQEPQLYKNLTDISNSSLTDMSCNRFSEIRIHYAFILPSIILFISTIGFLYLFLYRRCCHQHLKCKDYHEVSTIKQSFTTTDKSVANPAISLTMKVFLLVIVSFLLAFYCIVENNFIYFLMTFTFTYLKWDKTAGSYANATFWSCFSLGRFLGIFVVGCCKQSTLIIIHFLFFLFGYVAFYLSIWFRCDALIWVCIGILGWSMSVIYPAIYSWASSNVTRISGKVSSLFLVSPSLIGMPFPVLIGYLMDNYDFLWYVYLLLIVLVACISLFVCLLALVRFCKNGQQMKTKKPEETEISLMEQGR